MVVVSPGAKLDPDCRKRKTMREKNLKNCPGIEYYGLIYFLKNCKNFVKNCHGIEYYGLIYFLSDTINQNVSFLHFAVKTVLMNLSVAIHSSLKPVFPTNVNLHHDVER